MSHDHQYPLLADRLQQRHGALPRWERSLHVGALFTVHLQVWRCMQHASGTLLTCSCSMPAQAQSMHLLTRCMQLSLAFDRLLAASCKVNLEQKFCCSNVLFCSPLSIVDLQSLTGDRPVGKTGGILADPLHVMEGGHALRQAKRLWSRHRCNPRAC